MTATLYAKFQHNFGHFQLDIDMQSSKNISFLIGGNGAGKTTLSRCILGEIALKSGTIAVSDHLFFSKGEDRDIELSIQNRKIGYVPQQDVLFACFDVIDNIALGLWKQQEMQKFQARSLAQEFLVRMGLEDIGHQKPQNCSGGQKRLISIARALLMKPQFLLFDEPFHSVDLPTKIRLLPFVFEFIETHNIPCLWISHDGLVLQNSHVGERFYIEKGKSRIWSEWKQDQSDSLYFKQICEYMDDVQKM